MTGRKKIECTRHMYTVGDDVVVNCSEISIFAVVQTTTPSEYFILY